MSGFSTRVRYCNGSLLRELPKEGCQPGARDSKAMQYEPCTEVKAKHKTLTAAANRHVTLIMRWQQREATVVDCAETYALVDSNQDQDRLLGFHRDNEY